jgi:hypothetical protein
MGPLEWWIDLLDNHQTDLQILITFQKITGTITHKVFNTSTLRCSLYEFGKQVCTQSPLFCLVLGWGFYYSVGPSSISISFLVVCISSRQVLSNRTEITVSKYSHFASLLNNLYLSVVTETFVYVLRRNRCLCHNLGGVFQGAVT